MATYFDDFTGYTTGGALATDTSSAWAVQKSDIQFEHTIETFVGSTSGNALQSNYVGIGSPGYTMAVFETPGDQTGSIEVVCRFQWGEAASTLANTMVGPQLFGASNLGFGLRRTGADSYRITKWSTTGAISASVGDTITFSDFAADTWVWVRLGRVGGSPDTYRARIWLDGDSEPGTWAASGTDSSLSGLSVKAGVGIPLNIGMYQVDPLTYDIVGVGTGTDSAPTSGSTGNNAPTFDGSISNLTGTEGAAITPVDVSGEFSDADGDPLTFSQVGTWPSRSGGGSWVSGAGLISGTPASSTAGTYTALAVRASDGIDTVDSDPFTFTVSAASANAPTLDTVTFPIRHGSAATFTGTNLSGATVTIDYSTVSEAQTVTTTATSIVIASVVSDTLPYGTVTVSATTGDGTATLGVDHRPPVGRDYAVTAVPWDAESESIFEGGSVVDGDQVDFEVTTSLDATCLVREDGTVRVESDTGLHVFQARIWDESGLDWGALTDISVRPVGYEPGSPQFIGPDIDDADLTVGDSYSLDVSALFQDTDNDITSYTLVNDWPAWFSFNSATGIGSGIATSGDWPALQIQATDSTSNTGLSNLFSIVVTREAGTAIDKFVFRPRTLQSINEGRTLRFTVSFELEGAPFVPDTVRYRVDDEQSGTTVVDWTDVTPDDSITITLTGDDNQLVSETNRRERRTLTVEADAGTDYAANDYVQFDILNRQGI